MENKKEIKKYWNGATCYLFKKGFKYVNYWKGYSFGIKKDGVIVNFEKELTLEMKDIKLLVESIEEIIKIKNGKK